MAGRLPTLTPGCSHTVVYVTFICLWSSLFQESCEGWGLLRLCAPFHFMPSRDLLSYCFYRSAKKKRTILLRRLKVVCSPPLIFLRIVEKKTGYISLSFSLMLCWVNNGDAILKVNPYLEDIFCIRKFRPLCSFPSRCVRLGEDPISEATRKQICETRIEDEREYKVFVTVVCYWKLFFAFILVQMSLERTVALEMEYFPFSHWWFTKNIIFYSSIKVQQTKIQL